MYKKSKILPLIRKGLEECACLGVAIRMSGLKSASTLNVWRKPEGCRIDRYIKACITKSDNRRNDVVVDSLFKSAKDGNMTAVAIWLKFKMGWKDNPLIDQSYHTHITKIEVPNIIKSNTEWEKFAKRLETHQETNDNADLPSA